MMPKSSLLAVGLVAAAAASAVAAPMPTNVYAQTLAKFQESAHQPRELLTYTRELVADQMQRKCAEGDNQCFANCAKKFNKFDGEACFGLTAGQSFLENDGFDAIDTLLPSSDNVTNADLDKFCPCGGKVSSLLRTSIDVFSCIGLELEAEEGAPNFNTILDAFDVMIQFMCIKNGPDYCQVIANSDAVDIDQFNATDDDHCDALTTLGCCTASMIELLQSDEFQGLLGSGSDGEISGIREFQAGLTHCGLGDVEPCLKPGQSATFTKATITLQANFSALNNATKLREFKVAFATDVAKPLGVSPLQVEILSVTEGSIVVDFRVRGDVTTKLNTALTAGISLNNTRSVDSSYSGVADADSDDASGVQTEEVTNDADTAPAPAFGPASSLVLLLAAALAAFFL